VIGTDQHGQWSNSEEDEVEVSGGDLTLGMNHDRQKGSLEKSMAEICWGPWVPLVEFSCKPLHTFDIL